MAQWVYAPGFADRPTRPAAATRPHKVRARYDNATTTPENQRHWAAVDMLSAKSANSFWVRRQLRNRSRYEVANNPYLYGICVNNADDLIGTGPTLQLQTPDDAYNREVESAWSDWCAEVGFAEQLRTCKLARTVDGEGFLVFKNAPGLDHPVKLFPADVEADQVTTPAPSSLDQLWIDGLELDPVSGRPTYYHVLKEHPGDFFHRGLNPLQADRVQARHVVHWFPKSRPGQVRGIPVFSPALDLFTELRSFRKAVVRAAEVAADFAVSLQSEYPPNPDDTDQEYEPFARVPIDRGMMTVLPHGLSPTKLGNDQPATSYEMFQEKCLGEAVRPLNYPLNRALGTSQKFNFSSAKLDFLGYYAGLDIERVDCERVALTKTFRLWYEEAVLTSAVRAYDGLRTPPHAWHWPGHPAIDPGADADADHSRLSNGTDTLRDFWARRGRDYQDVLKQQAAEQEEVKRLGLRFGQPATKTETIDGDPPDAKARRTEGIAHA